jgi:hypothetical protein
MIIGKMISDALCSTVIWSPNKQGITIGTRRIGLANSRYDAIGGAIAWAKKRKFFFKKNHKVTRK